MEELLPAVIEGDQGAWRRLWLILEPQIETIARKRHLTGRLCEREDERGNIVVAVMDRLRADDFRHLRAFLSSRAQRESSSFTTWFTSFATRTAIDYVRTHSEYERPSHADAGTVRASGSRWVRFEPVPDSSSAPAAATADVTRLAAAQQFLERAAHILTREQREALALWLVDQDHDEIAYRLGLADAPAAKKLLRSAVERLRFRYASGDDR